MRGACVEMRGTTHTGRVVEDGTLDRVALGALFGAVEAMG